jgi:putative endonuclease
VVLGSIPSGPTKNYSLNSFYILFSRSLNKYYVGITSDSVSSRLIKHNTSSYGSRYTSQAKDWELKCEIICDSFSEARKMELYVKRMKSKIFIEKIIGDEGERKKLLDKIKST